jgi:hypothetical protein
MKHPNRVLMVWMAAIVISSGLWAALGYFAYHAIPAIKASQHKHVAGYYEYSQFVGRNP